MTRSQRPDPGGLRQCGVERFLHRANGLELAWALRIARIIIKHFNSLGGLPTAEGRAEVSGHQLW